MTNGGEQPQYYIFGGNQPEQQNSGTSQYFPFNNKLSYQNNNSNSNEYKDSSISDIEGFLKAFLKAINKNKNKDEDYLKAGERTCNSYIAKIKNYGNKTEELEPLINLQKEITKDYDLFDTIKRCTNNIQKINIVAKKIDDAENEVLQRIKKNKTIKESERITKESEIIQGKKMFETMNDGSLVFTKASNPVKIHEALKGLFTDPKIVYQIDYSNIDTSDRNGTGQRIKDKVIELTGTTTCYLSYDQETNTYVLRDREHGDPIKGYRARIWNGVKLIPEGVRQRQSHEQLQQINRNEYNNLGVTPQSQQTTQLNSMLNTIPSAKEKLTADEQKQLMEKTEKRILYLLKMAKQLGYEIDSQEPISKVWGRHGHMELHLTDPVTGKKMSWKIRENENTENLGKKLYDFIDKNEGDYKKYLTTIVHQKRAQLESLTRRNKIDLSGEDTLDEEKLKQLLYGMSAFKNTVEIERNSSSAIFWVKIYKLLDDGIYSIENSSTISGSKVYKNIIDKLREYYYKGKGLSKEPTGELAECVDVDPLYAQAQKNFYQMFFGGNDKQRQSIRYISEKGIGNTDKTSSSHLENDIIDESFDKNNDGYVNKFQVKNKKENDCVDRIYNYDIELEQNLFDSTGNLTVEGKNKVKSIDTLYEKAATCDTNPNIYAKNSFIKYVVGLGLLPPYSSGWNSSNYDSKIVDAAIKLKNKLNSIKRQIDNFPTTTMDLAEADHKEKLILEQKENKTEDDIKRLQVLEYLENNPAEQYRINQITINMMKSELKYGGFAQGLASCLFEPLADFGGGAIGGYNASIFNDITGAGLRNLSDTNAVMASQIVVEIIITVIVAVATCGAGAAITAGALRLGAGAARLGKAARWVKLANNIEKIIRLNNLGMKGFRLASTVGKISMLTTHATSLLIEAAMFNTASDIIHSAINGTSLDNITNTLNPITRENIQTAAFLGVLSINSQILGKFLQQGRTTRLSINFEKGLEAANKLHPQEFTAQLVSEMTSMLAAEQTINFVFGHDVINPETGEVERSRSLEWPSEQEWIQMIGMILAFKAVKPGIRQKYAQKLNDGTLEICRGVKKNQTLLRDPITGKVEDLQTLIDGNYNNYKKTAEQHKLNNYNKRLENQSKYNGEYTKAKEIISEIPENMRTESMKKFLETGDMNDFPVNDIKRIQREIGLTGKDIDGVLGPNTLGKLKDYTLKKGLRINVDNGVSTNDKFRNKAIEELYDKFDSQIMSEQGITIDGTTYKLERKPNEGHNSNRKGKIVYTETGPDGKTRTTTVESDTFSIPENSNGKSIKNRFNVAREKYIRENIEASMQSVRGKAERELVSEIDSKSKDLEGKRKNRANLEGKKKTLSDEINGLKSRKAQLEQQLQNISKELVHQPDIVSLNNIYSIIRTGNKVSIGGKKMTFIGVKGDKIVFAEGGGKTREFSSFKELNDAKVNFNIDIKSRQSDRGLEQQIMFEELVGKEARTSNANEIIREYERLQRQKSQIEKDIKDGYFRENADRLVGKQIWIDGVERQCTHKNPKNGNLTFKKTDGHEYFSISSFEQLKSKGQVNGFGDRYTVQNKETRAAGRELSQYEKNNHELLRGENGVFKGEGKYIEGKKQELNQINNELSSSKPEYENAKLQNAPKKKANPEYERIQKEIEGIDEQIKSKGKDLIEIEKDLGASNTEIEAIEKEINELTAERDNLINEKMGEGKTIENNQGTTQKEQIEMKNEIPNFNNENGKFELTYIEKINNGTLKIKENGMDIGEANFSVRENCIYIDGLISSKKGCGTQLMQKLVEISESMGKGGHIELTASPYIDAGTGKKSYREGKTNLGFYYKLGFEAKDPEIHKQIQEYINKGEDIPFKLNVLTEVHLTEKGINNLKNGQIETKLDALVKSFDDFLKEREVINNNTRTHEEGTIKELSEKLDKCTDEELDYIFNHSSGELQNQSYRILENRGIGGDRPKSNPGRNDRYTKETLNSYNEGEVFELGYNTEQGSTREIYIKEKDGYFKVIEKDGKYVKTEEKIAETEMVEKMRGRTSYKSEIKLPSNIEETNNNEGILKILESVKLEDYMTIAIDGKINFNVDYLKYNRKTKRRYLEIQGNEYQIFENGKGDGIGVMLGSRESASVNGKIIDGMKSRGEYDMQIGNFKNGKLEGEGIRISRGMREEGTFKDGKLEGEGKIYKDNQLVYEGQFKDGIKRDKGPNSDKKLGEKRQKEEQERGQEEQNIPEAEILYSEIAESQLNTLRNLNRGRNEQIYLNEFGEPKNVISLGNGENLYVSNCLQSGSRKYIVGYVQKGGEMKLRLFYRSKSEGAWRSCPGVREKFIGDDGQFLGGGGYSKGENIPNSSYETTTRVLKELQYKFDNLPTDIIRRDPIDLAGVTFNALEPEMASEIKIDKLFNGLSNNTIDYIKGKTAAEVKDMYRRLGVGVDTSGMKIVEGKGYTYQHQYLGTIEVKVCRLNYNGKDLDYSFARAKGDPQNRVRIEEVNYADAEISSFGIYDKQINAAPLTGKPVDYVKQVPIDMQSNRRIGDNYIDIRDLYQENPLIKKYKELSQQQGYSKAA